MPGVDGPARETLLAGVLFEPPFLMEDGGGCCCDDADDEAVLEGVKEAPGRGEEKAAREDVSSPRVAEVICALAWLCSFAWADAACPKFWSECLEERFGVVLREGECGVFRDRFCSLRVSAAGSKEC